LWVRTFPTFNSCLWNWFFKPWFKDFHKPIFFIHIMQTKKACILGCLSHHHVLICFFLLKFETFYNAAYLLMENGFRQFNDFHPSWKPSNPSTFKKSSPHYKSFLCKCGHNPSHGSLFFHLWTNGWWFTVSGLTLCPFTKFHTLGWATRK
jgi:hypothetical protein